MKGRHEFLSYRGGTILLTWRSEGRSIPLISTGLGFGLSGENVYFGDDTIDGGVIENHRL